MSALFKARPIGDPVNGSPHSVCVNLPTMGDVIGYEEGDPRVLKALKAGYPRFFRNPLITGLAARYAASGLMEATGPLLPSHDAALDLAAFLGGGQEAVEPVGPCWTVRLAPEPETRKAAQAFLQHTGSGLSSREAEAILLSDFGVPSFPEERHHGSTSTTSAHIRAHLHAIYGTASEADIHLFRSGMNAFYAGFRALQDIQAPKGRDLWIQLGWLYVDTVRILERFSPPDAPPVQIFNILDLVELKAFLSEKGHRVAGIVTEVPTNPLVQTPDLESLRSLADKAGAALVLDPTLVSPHNLNILSFCDLHINSLTKYAAAEADVMMGALALHPGSRFYDELRQRLPGPGSPPGAGDLARMAFQIDAYGPTIRRINQSTLSVVAFLEAHPATRSVHWARKLPAGLNFNRLQHREAGPGGIISFSLRKPVEGFHDPSRIVKSPSFGARFTMMCPFMYLAHYDLVRSPNGRARLRTLGIDPDLIRLSVGLEPPEAIIGELERTLK